jgi:hypothetical protein
VYGERTALRVTEVWDADGDDGSRVLHHHAELLGKDNGTMLGDRLRVRLRHGTTLRELASGGCANRDLARHARALSYVDDGVELIGKRVLPALRELS